MGREWNAKLMRRLTTSINAALDRPKAVRLLVTDLEGSPDTLVEVISEANEVIGAFIVTPEFRPKTLRYRAERGWPK